MTWYLPCLTDVSGYLEGLSRGCFAAGIVIDSMNIERVIQKS